MHSSYVRFGMKSDKKVSNQSPMGGIGCGGTVSGEGKIEAKKRPFLLPSISAHMFAGAV